MIKIIILSLWIMLSNGIDINFKVENTQFLQKTGNGWKNFGNFAGVNFGITKPGYEPGQVSLNYNDYIKRFEYLEVLGINVIRVYSLLQPGFYQALLDWNKQHTPIYVLQGTAFPEYEMEHNNGTSAFDTHITELMEFYIKTTVAGVYGTGKVIYKYDYSHGGKQPIYGDYKANIAKYLLGWVISGEISPQCINKTNNDYTQIYYNGNEFSFQGRYFSTKYHDNSKTNCIPRNKPSGFETWTAKLFELVATESVKYGHMAPISHTNWVTTDGVCHNIEPDISDIEYGSVEDWQEFDLHYIDFKNWPAGMFFNQHAYPYYPEMVKIKGNDSFVDYIKTIKSYYSEYPFVITEIGLPTSIGVSSVDRVHNRHHGHNGETQQGDMLYSLLSSLINKENINGVMVFQLYDEWFKKSWNTMKSDLNRQNWKNMLTSEQYFGIMDVSSHPQFFNNRVSKSNDYYSVEIRNNYEYIELVINLKKYDEIPKKDKINIGIDMFPDGVSYIDSIGNFKNNIDAYISIESDKVDFKISSQYNAFKSHYGLWLQPETFPKISDNQFAEFWENNKDIRDICYNNNCESLQKYKEITTFDDFKMLVKVPTNGTWVDPNCINDRIINSNSNINIDGIDRCYIIKRKGTNIQDTIYDANIYTVEFLTKENANDDNLALVERKPGFISIKLPYQMLGFSDPSSHNKTFFEGLGKDFIFNHQEYKEDINFELSYSIMDIPFENSKINIPFNWENWDYPEFWGVKPKKSFNSFRMLFHEINKGYTPNNLTKEELDKLIWYNKKPSYNIHFYLVRGSIYILFLFFITASIGKLILKDLAYCYSSKKFIIGSYRLIYYNFMAAVGLFVYWWFNMEITYVVMSPIYFIYIGLLSWDSFLLLLLIIFNKWNLFEKITEEYNTFEHAFVIACHNSSEVLEKTLKSLLTKVPASQIYVADNGSTEKEQELSKNICNNLDININYGHIAFDTKINGKIVKRGNKTMAQFAAISHLDSSIKYVTCIDDDTRLHETWDVNKVIKYFKDDENIAVLAYPLTADNPYNDIEWFQAIEYLIAGFFKIFHSKIYSTIFNSGAFGTYRVDIVKEALLYHNTDYHGDDLQICMNIHQLKGKKYYNSDQKHTKIYKVATATNMVGTTEVPKCWFHMSSFSSCFKSKCDCGNPDLLSQRCKGWFVSSHRFIPKYIKMIFNINGVHGLWVRFVALYELIIILNEYFAIVYIVLFMKNIGWWMLEGFFIAYTFTVIVMCLFDFKVLKKNKQYIPYEFITMQPLIYKLFMITFYRYFGLIYNLFIYSIKHRSGIQIIKRLKDPKFRETIDQMYSKNLENPIHNSPSPSSSLSTIKMPTIVIEE